MTTKRQRKKHLEEAVGWIVAIANRGGVDKEEKKRVQSFVRTCRSFFSRSWEGDTPFAYLRLGERVELAFSRVSLDTLLIRHDGNFSEAGAIFRPWKEAWGRDVPTHIKSSFNLSLAAMSREIYEVSED